MGSSPLDPTVAAIRRFSRFYTARIGVLGNGYLGTDMSVTESRVVYELGTRGPLSASEIAAELTLDAGYLSRILAQFRRDGLVTALRAPEDRRRSVIALTPAGRALFNMFDARSSAEVGELVAGLDVQERERLAAALDDAARLLGAPPADPASITLRDHRVGDMGWLVERHGALYAAEFGWGIQFEALVAEIVAGLIRSFDPARERCWVAESAGRRLGSVTLVRHDDGMAKLRLLIVEPAARGTGLGRRLVSECVAFARARGYRGVTLWTQANLLAARRLYDAAGFRCVHSEPYDDLGVPLVSETWTLTF